MDISSSYGAALIGCFLSTIFWTVLLTQTTYYFTHFHRDRWYLRAVAYVLPLVCSAYQITYIFSFWEPLISHYGDESVIIQVNRAFSTLAGIDGVAGLIAQLFFIHRIFTFAKHPSVKWGIPALLLPTVLLGFAFTLYWMVILDVRLATIKQTTEYEWAVFITQISRAVADALIATTMAVLLYNSRTGIRSTDRVLRLMIVISVNSGAWTAVAAITTAILLAASPSTLWYIIPGFCNAPLYSNAVLGNLTARNVVRTGDSERPSLRGDPRPPAFRLEHGDGSVDAETGISLASIGPQIKVSRDVVSHTDPELEYGFERPVKESDISGTSVKLQYVE